MGVGGVNHTCCALVLGRHEQLRDGPWAIGIGRIEKERGEGVREEEFIHLGKKGSEGEGEERPRVSE